MSLPIFLSYSSPFNGTQERFIAQIKKYLKTRRLEARTLGVTDYNMSEPLKEIRRMMLESNGVITVAFRRSQINSGMEKPETDNQKSLNGKWLTSPFCQIEPAMAFQLGLPLLTLREKGVLEDGILQKSVVGHYMPSFDLTRPIDEYFDTEIWAQTIIKWETQVQTVAKTKGTPPKLF